jgi:hypothetical protein
LRVLKAKLLFVEVRSYPVSESEGPKNIKHRLLLIDLRADDKVSEKRGNLPSA